MNPVTNLIRTNPRLPKRHLQNGGDDFIFRGQVCNGVKYFIRRAVFYILYFLYLFIRPFLRKPEVAVLMYHSISDNEWFFAVSPQEFERQMRYVKRYCNPIPLRHVAEYIEGKRSLPPRSVAITFDDGYKDFLVNALSVLEKYQVPATIFICAGEVDRSELGSDLPLLSWEKINEVLRVSAYAEGQNSRQSALVEIGSHGLTHKKLGRISPEEAKNEINESRVIIKEKIGAKPDFFAYPKGNFSKAVRDLVMRAGYLGAVSVEQRTVKKNDNPYSMPRIQIDDSHPFFEFRARITKVSDWYYFLWKHLIGGQ